jgi:hypothetical protein
VQRGMKPVVEVDGKPVSARSDQHEDGDDEITISLA